MNEHFPAPYPDELLYSVLARLVTRIGYLSWPDYGWLIWGAKTATGIMDLPNRLESLADSMPEEFDITADQLIDQNTLWPYYAAFLPTERRLRTREEMKGKGQPRVLFGLIASRAPRNEWLRYCSECARSDRTRFGEAYWHRVHQIPGCVSCAEHGNMLTNSTVAIWQRRNRQAYLAAEDFIPQDPAATTQVTELQRAIAEDSAWLLAHPKGELNVPDLKERVTNQLISMGLANHRGNLRIEQLNREVVKRFGAGFLNELACFATNPANEWNMWVAKLARNPDRAYHPLHHLLVLRLVSIAVESLLQPMPPYHPFGDGPWPCLNSASDHCGEAIVEHVDAVVTSSGRSLRGTFLCEKCGMSYERLGPDATEADKWRWDHVPVYGPVWEEALKSLWPDRDISLREISRRLGVDPNTVYRQVKRLGLHLQGGRKTTVEWKEITSMQPSNGPQSDSESYKAAWIAIRHKYPAEAVTALRKREPAAYAFLRRHEADWLRSQTPKMKTNRAHTSRVDWEARDVVCSQDIRCAWLALLKRSPPRRITLNTLLTESGHRTITSRNLRHLPDTKALTSRLCENHFQFATRRIAISAECLREQGRLTYQNLLREASIGRKLCKHEGVQQALIGALGGK